MALLRNEGIPGVLRLEGEIDLATADRLEEALRSAIASGTTSIDLSDVTFMDCTGLHILVSAGDRLNGQGPLVLLRPSKAVRRLIEIALPGGIPTLAVRDA